MNISLTPELDSFVKNLVESGDYFSASEVVREGLRLLKDKEALREIKLRELREAIQKGKDDIEAGRYTEINSAEELDAFMEDIKTACEARLKQKQQKETV